MEIIDKSKWPRREHFEFFSPFSDPFFSLTFSLDVTKLYEYTKAKGLSFYYSLCWLTAKAMNGVEAFKYKIRGDDILLTDELIPSFTDIRQNSDLFYIVTLPAGDDMEDFCFRAGEKSRAQQKFIDWEEENDSLIYITCLPWFEMTAFKNEKDVDKDDSIPRVAWGKYVRRNGALILHYSLELNHRLTDGRHAGLFYQKLEALINAPDKPGLLLTQDNRPAG
ncbi:MAG: CatA-like O-acetyltransferase [Oscillospiraceae bacterium]|nr:CatA-like O-acetyltransferase [Oscillospiraceae bacterium]